MIYRSARSRANPDNAGHRNPVEWIDRFTAVAIEGKMWHTSHGRMNRPAYGRREQNVGHRNPVEWIDRITAVAVESKMLHASHSRMNRPDRDARGAWCPRICRHGAPEGHVGRTKMSGDAPCADCRTKAKSRSNAA